MKGQFEFTQELINGSDLTEIELVKIMLDQQLRKANVSERERLVTGWHARKTDPYTGNRQYLWDTNISSKLFNQKYKEQIREYFRLLKMEGWEIPYKLDL